MAAPTAWETIQGRTAAVRVYCTISGLDQCYANWGPCPTAWDAGGGTVTIGGETYTWNRSLEARNGFGQLSSTLDLKNGTVKSGVCSLRFRLPGTNVDASANDWLSKLARSPDRADVYHASLADDFEISDATLTVHDNSAWPASGTIYVGTETVTYSAKPSATTFTIDARALFRSQEKTHLGRISTSSEIGSGMRISSNPVAWQGRIVRVWLCFGSVADGAFTPYGATAESTSDMEWFRGIIADRRIAGNQMYVDIELASLDQLMNAEIGGRLPSSRAGIFSNQGAPQQSVWIDDTTNRLAFAIHSLYGTFYADDDGSVTNVEAGNGIQLLTDGAPTTPLPDGMYTLSELVPHVRYTINQWLTGTSDVTSVYMNANGTTGKCDLKIAHRNTASTDPLGLEIVADGGCPNNLWRAVGFTSNQLKTVDNSSEVKEFVFESDKEVPYHYIAWAEAGTPARIYYEPLDTGAPAFDASPGWVTSKGGTVNGFVRVGEEIFEFSGTGTTDGLPYLTIVDQATGSTSASPSRRVGVGNSIAHEHRLAADIKEPDKTKFEEITQGFALTDVTAALAMLQALESGSGAASHNGTYDKGPLGCGANVDSGQLSEAAFERADDRLSSHRFDFIAAFSPTRLRDFMNGELVLSQLGIGSQNRYDTVSAAWSGYLIQPFDMLPPMLHELTNAIDVGVGEISREKEIGDDDHDDKIVTRIVVDTIWDHGAQKYLVKGLPITHRSFRDTYGETRDLKIGIKGIVGVERVVERLLDYAMPTFTMFGEPYRGLTIPMASLWPWGWSHGQILSVTHPLLVKRDAIGRGLTSRKMRLYDRSSILVGPDNGGSVFSEVRCLENDVNLVGITPTMKVTALSAGTTYVVTQNHFRDACSLIDDTDDFELSDAVFCYEPGDEEHGVVRTISAKTATTVTLSSATGLGYPFYVTQVNYNHVSLTNRQSTYAYMADTDELLDLNGGGTDPAHRYS